MNADTPAYRYAVYYAPRPDSAWWQAGSHWLGRCAAQRTPLPQPDIPGVPPATLQRLTAAPRRYGWHATLKAPFALAPGVTPVQLQDAMQTLTRQVQPFSMPALQLTQLDDFLALVPAGDSRAIDAVAAACVTQLHALAAPLPPAELQRRRAAGLTPHEDALLLRWGYPHVLDRFRFHLSLTGSLQNENATEVQALQRAAEQHFGNLPPCRFDTLALFAEPTPGADFLLLQHVELGA